MIKVILFDVDKVLVQNLGDEHWENVALLMKRTYGVSISGKDFYQKIYYLSNKNEILNGLQNGSLNGHNYVAHVNQALKAYGCLSDLTLDEYYRIVFADRLNTPKHEANLLANEIHAFKQSNPHIHLGLITDRMHGDEQIFKDLLNQLYPGLFNDAKINFFSSEVGHSKRGKDLFEYVVKALGKNGYQPSEILIIDDRVENRVIAESFGFQVKEFLWGSPAGEMTRLLKQACKG